MAPESKRRTKGILKIEAGSSNRVLSSQLVNVTGSRYGAVGYVSRLDADLDEAALQPWRPVCGELLQRISA